MAGEGLRIHRTHAILPYLKRNVKSAAPVFSMNLPPGFSARIPAIRVTLAWLLRANRPAGWLWAGRWLAWRSRHAIGASARPIFRRVRGLRLAVGQGSAGSAIMLDMPI